MGLSKLKQSNLKKKYIHVKQTLHQYFTLQTEVTYNASDIVQIHKYSHIHFLTEVTMQLLIWYMIITAFKHVLHKINNIYKLNSLKCAHTQMI